MNSIAVAAYLALFFGVAILFVFVNLLIGRFLRPRDPHDEKLEVYECGEPTIGSSFVQFDLRFYVVALLFLIFDVEVAFFFPWATVFGKATHLADTNLYAVQGNPEGAAQRDAALRGLHRELGVESPMPPPEDADGVTTEDDFSEYEKQKFESLQRVFDTNDNDQITAEEVAAVVPVRARQLAWFSFADIAVFFGVVLVGFAYVWMRGDLDWVRAVSRERAAQYSRPPPPPAIEQREPVLAP